jgi:hypothetical protein
MCWASDEIGSKAREDYNEQDESGMLFETFKMCLHDDHRGLEPVAFALNDKPVSLLTVITHSLKYVVLDAMAEINRNQVTERERQRQRQRETERQRQSSIIYIPRHTYKLPTYIYPFQKKFLYFLRLLRSSS